MKHQFKKIALLAAMTAAFGIVSSNAMSAEFFTVNESSVQPTNAQIFQANYITGQYGEAVTFNANNTFSTTLIFQGANYLNGSFVPSNLNGLNGYNLYATLTATGTYTQNGAATTFTFTPNSGAGLNVFIDANQDTKFSAFTSGTQGSVITGNGSTDILIATGGITQGGGTLNCAGNGANCGSFGTKTSFALTPDGKNYFVAPNPFYDLTFSSGDFRNFTPQANTTQYTQGGASLNFEVRAVPEPETLALLGVGLLGLGLTMRRRKQA